MLYTPYGLYLKRSLSQANIFFDVFSKNGIENYPAAGENLIFFIIILKVSQTHFFKDFYPKGGHTFFKGEGGGL